MFVRSALMINSPAFEEDDIENLVATPEEFEEFKDVIHDIRMGGFGAVTPVIKKGTTKVRHEIQRFYENREVQELLLVYLNGYELVNVDDEIYFADPDSDLNRLEQTTIPVQFIYDCLKACKAEKKILIIDTFSRSEVSEERKLRREKRLAEFSRATRSFVIYSLDTLGTSFTTEGIKNPKFTQSMTKGLKTGDADLDKRGYITEDELFIFTYKEMNQHGVAPNLFLNSAQKKERIRIAKNVQFANLSEYAKEDSAVDLGRFFRLVGSKKNVSSEDELRSLNKVIRAQPEVTAFKRIVRALVVATIAAVLAAVVTNISIPKAIIIGFIAIFGVIIDGLISQKLSS